MNRSSNCGTLTVVSVLITNLTTRPATTELSTLLEAGVPIGTNLSIVQFGAVHVAHRIAGTLAGRVLDKAKAARRLPDSIQTDHHAIDLAALGEQLVDLLFGRVERQVAHVQGGRLEQHSGLFVFGALGVGGEARKERTVNGMKNRTLSTRNCNLIRLQSN